MTRRKIQAILRVAEKDKLGIALKGSSEGIRELFFANMSERAAKILREDMEAMGPIRLKDVEESQGYLIRLTKDLADKGEVTISDNKGGDEMIY
jgi:flagellar motor switch protein FliG